MNCYSDSLIIMIPIWTPVISNVIRNCQVIELLEGHLYGEK